MEIKNNTSRSEQIKKLDSNGYLIAVNDFNEGIYFVDSEKVGRDVFKSIIREGEKYHLKRVYHVYGKCCTFCVDNLIFYRITEF